MRKLKRERRQVSERSTEECPVERKTAKVQTIDCLKTEPVNDMFGLSKLAHVQVGEEKGGLAMQQSLCDDDKD